MLPPSPCWAKNTWIALVECDSSRVGQGNNTRNRMPSVAVAVAVAANRPLYSLGNSNANVTHMPQQKKHAPICCYSRPISPNLKKFGGAAASRSSTPATSTTKSFPPTGGSNGLQVEEIGKRCKKWLWQGQYSINYLVSASDSDSDSNSGPPLLLVHGFGASIPHWRRNIDILAQNYTVYAIDLLGFGASEKPEGFSYTMEAWAQLILDFLDEVIKKPTVLVGNSVGSLACVIAASDLLESSNTQNLVRGIVLLNCAGGMNNKAIVDDWRIKLLFPLLWLVDFLLKQRPIASAIFERVKQRETLRNILLSVYGRKESVDDELVEIIRGPANDEGALDAFVSIVTGPPGPNPVKLMPRISIPVLVLWGDNDPFTPLDGPVGKYFSSLPSQLSNVTLYVLEGAGHCPHDDISELVHDNLLPWLANLDALMT